MTERTDLLRAWWKSVLERQPFPPIKEKVPVSTTVFPELMQDMADQSYRQQVYIVAETQMHVAPWLFEEEGWEKSRLKQAIELVCAGKVIQTSHGWEVKGSGTVYPLAGDPLVCPCKASQHGKTGICKHRVAVELARRVQQAYPQDTPLPLPPVTVEERLALSTMHDHTALQTSHTPQEDRMSDDAALYMPTPTDTTTAVLEPPGTTAATPRPLPGPVLLPSLDARTLEQSMQAWGEQRQVVKRFLQTQLVDGTDYYSLKLKSGTTKPTLSKAGSEKFLGLFQLHATFSQDEATWTMLGKPEGTLCYVCHLMTRSGEIVGEGRGARRVSQDNGDINKAVKMAQKSATIDAVLRTGALSEAFTQDIGEEDLSPGPTTPAMQSPTSQELRQRIWAIIKEQAPECGTRASVEAFIKERTGMDLHPDLYAAIVTRLTEVGR